MSGSDADREPVSGCGNSEIVGQVHIQEWRNVKPFGAGVMGAFSSRGQNVAVPLLKGIVHFVNESRGRSIRVSTKIDAQGIEAIAQGSRHAQKLDRPTASVDIMLRQGRPNLIPEWSVAAIAMVTIKQAEQVKAVVRKQAQVHLRQSVHIYK